MWFLKQQHVHQLFYMKILSEKRLWGMSITQNQGVQEKAQQTEIKPFLKWMAQAEAKMTFNMRAQGLLLSALFGNPDLDACLVDKSVTLEIGRNSVFSHLYSPATDGGRGINQAHISNFILFFDFLQLSGFKRAVYKTGSLKMH